MKAIYESPELTALDIVTEGLLCESRVNVDMDPEIGNM